MKRFVCEWCSDGCNQEQRSYPAMRNALNKTGRPIFVSINGWNMSNDDPGSVSNCWRTTPDDDVEFIPKLISGIFKNDEYLSWQGVGKYNDPDSASPTCSLRPLAHAVDCRSLYAPSPCALPLPPFSLQCLKSGTTR